jgi:hypothetical protein
MVRTKSFLCSLHNLDLLFIQPVKLVGQGVYLALIDDVCLTPCFGYSSASWLGDGDNGKKYY